MISLTVNGDPMTLDGTTVADLVAQLQLSGRRLAVEVNRDIVPKSEHGQHPSTTATWWKSCTPSGWVNRAYSAIYDRQDVRAGRSDRHGAAPGMAGTAPKNGTRKSRQEWRKSARTLFHQRWKPPCPTRSTSQARPTNPGC